MLNAKLDESKTTWRNINDLRYADDTTLMAESEEKLKSLLMKVKESEKASLKFNIDQTYSGSYRVLFYSFFGNFEFGRTSVLYLSCCISNCPNEINLVNGE